MKKISNLITIFIFIFIIGVLSVITFISKDKNFSKNENRYLQQKPKLSAEGILSGEFEQKSEKYINDQFAFRNIWMSKKAQLNMFLHKKDINGVYICKENYLIDKCTEDEFNNKQFKSNIEYINKFNEYTNKLGECKTSVLIAPTSAFALKDKLPTFSQDFNQSEKIDLLKSKLKGCSFVDIRETISMHKDEYIYFKTDHHWTSKGAYLAYLEWRKDSSIKANNFDVETVSDRFRGSLYSKVLYKDSAYDKIELYKPKNKVSYEVLYNFNKKKSTSMFDYSKLNEKDKYLVYFGGNYPELKITTTNKNKKNILIIKDSYANSFIPFIVNDYKNICVLDLRYTKFNIKQYIKENNISEILFLYNLSSFSSDKNICKLGV